MARSLVSRRASGHQANRVLTYIFISPSHLELYFNNAWQSFSVGCRIAEERRCTAGPRAYGLMLGARPAWWGRVLSTHISIPASASRLPTMVNVNNRTHNYFASWRGAGHMPATRCSARGFRSKQVGRGPGRAGSAPGARRNPATATTPYAAFAS